MEPLNEIDPELREIESVKNIPHVTSKIFDSFKKRKKEREVSPLRNFLVGFVFIAIISAFIYRKEIATVSKDLFSQAALYLVGIDMELPETEPIIFDTEAFFDANPNAFRDKNNKITARYTDYGDYNALNQQVGMVLPESDELHFSNISVYIEIANQTGSINMRAASSFGNYYLVGKFSIEGYTPSGTYADFEQGDKATSALEYADGKNAYLIKNWGYGTQTIYFEEGGILYRFTINDTEADLETAKKLMEMMAE